MERYGRDQKDIDVVVHESKEEAEETGLERESRIRIEENQCDLI